jgi:hypothetical protein
MKNIYQILNYKLEIQNIFEKRNFTFIADTFTCGTGTAYLYRTPEFTPSFLWGTCLLLEIKLHSNCMENKKVLILEVGPFRSSLFLKPYRIRIQRKPVNILMAALSSINSKKKIHQNGRNNNHVCS